MLPVWRGPSESEARDKPHYWRTVELEADGGLLVQTDYGALARIDRRSRVLWELDVRTHHDFDVREDGRVFVLINEFIEHERYGRGIDDIVLEVDPQGVAHRRVSVVDALIAGGQSEVLAEIAAYRGSASGVPRMDITHANSLDLVGSVGAPQHPAFVGGRMLLSLRTVHRLVLLDFDAGRVVWTLAGSFRTQHDPSLVGEHILLFDDSGPGSHSSALEIESATGATRRAYAEEGTKAFFSECCGRVHRLANGNTLIVASNPGLAIEVTVDGQPVWEYRNPEQTNGHVAILSDVVRIPAERARWRLQ